MEGHFNVCSPRGYVCGILYTDLPRVTQRNIVARLWQNALKVAGFRGVTELPDKAPSSTAPWKQGTNRRMLAP